MFVDHSCQVHPYVLPLRLFKKVMVSLCLGALLLPSVPSCAHSMCVNIYFVANIVMDCMVALFWIWLMPSEWKDGGC